MRIKVVVLLLALLSAAGCANNSTSTEAKEKSSNLPTVTASVPEKKVKATINF